MLQVNTVDYRGSVCDGPGIRVVVFLQGCTRHCANCHNPETWPLKGGRSVRPEDLAAEIIQHSFTNRVTISGGEPLLQGDELVKLLALLKQAGFELALYTSWDQGSVPADVMKLIDYLKTGEYVDELRSTVTPYVGSTNQLFVKVA